MPQEESRLIEIVRVFCIATMMWVHVNPGLATASIVTRGDFALVGAVLGDTLGRISVALLSFVSGYLFWRQGRNLPLLGFARHRFRSVLLPMLIWSAIFLLLAAAKEPLTGMFSSKVRGIDPDPVPLANAWAGISGPTANVALFFLRDLFVASLILRLAVPAIRRAPMVVAGVVIVGATGDWLAPVIFRPAILQFLFLGAIAARYGFSLLAISRPALSLTLGYLLLVAAYLAQSQAGNPLLQPLHLPIFFRRAGISMLLLALAGAFLALYPGTRLDRVGRHAYLAFLMHVPLVGILWAGWLRFVGGPDEASYLAFYLSAPVTAFAAAVLLGLILDRSPGVLQIALRGRIVRGPRKRPAD